MALPKTLGPFTAHGAVFKGQSGTNWYSDCPFTGSTNKLYVNAETQLWDIKHLGLSGNIYQWLKAVAEHNATQLTLKAKLRLSRDRGGFPWEAFKSWGVGWNGLFYTVPVRDPGGRVTDVRTYRLGDAIRSTDGCKLGLMGIEHLDKRPQAPIYICEGEWDGMALAWLFEQVHHQGCVVATPGAAVFKKEWVPSFAGRDVLVLMDHDQPGVEAEKRIQQSLSGVVRSLRYVRWPEECPTGFDTRDWVVHGAIKRGTPRACWRKLLRRFQAQPRDPHSAMPAGQGATQPGDPVQPPQTGGEDVKPAGFSEVEAVFQRWLWLPSSDSVWVTLATALSQHLDGDPVWLFLVAPPGASKTETLQSLSTHPAVHTVSALTTHSLISGASGAGGRDPSLIPRLDGRVLIVKDFTTILSMHSQDRDHIFGILRDAYDGYCSKEFGNGIVRTYKSRFTVIAAVTPAVYDPSIEGTRLGERFLKYFIGHPLNDPDADSIIDKALSNVNLETQMREELQEVVYRFLHKPVTDESIPTVPASMEVKIRWLAKWGARMRGFVARNKYRPDQVENVPTAEMPTRLAKQLKKMALALAMAKDRTEVSPEDYRVLCKVANDSAPPRIRAIVEYLWHVPPGEYKQTGEIAGGIQFPRTTVIRLLTDMHMLGLVAQLGGTTLSFKWKLSDEMRRTTQEAEVYGTERSSGNHRDDSVERTSRKTNGVGADVSREPAHSTHRRGRRVVILPGKKA